jgi:hypothetical protein
LGKANAIDLGFGEREVISIGLGSGSAREEKRLGRGRGRRRRRRRGQREEAQGKEELRWRSLRSVSRRYCVHGGREG